MSLMSLPHTTQIVPIQIVPSLRGPDTRLLVNKETHRLIDIFVFDEYNLEI